MRGLIALALCAVMYSCAQPTASNPWPVDMEALADMHCRARVMREARFALADTMRMTESRFLGIENRTAADSAAFAEAMEGYAAQRDKLVDSSKSLADSIAAMLSTAIKALSLGEKRVLNDSLERMVKRRGCDV